MIERNYPFENYTAFCDRCSFDKFFDFSTWNEVIQEMKNDGWRIRKVDGDWEHLCPTCANKER